MVGTVYVETEWDPHDPIGETRYVESLRHTYGLPTVSVAQAWLDREDCTTVLEQQAAFGFVRGVRHKPRANPVVVVFNLMVGLLTPPMGLALGVTLLLITCLPWITTWLPRMAMPP